MSTATSGRTISVDTNIFVYAADGRDAAKNAVARSVLAALGRADVLIGLQVVSELQNAMRRRLRTAPWVAYQAARNVLVRFPSFAYDEQAVDTALGEAIVGRLSYWDALLLAAADAVGVSVMISEDMTDGLRFRGLEVVNPFGEGGLSERLRAILDA